jgi:competence protein ComEC
MSSSRRFEPLFVAIALATGIAVAPALDRLGLAPALRWGLAAVLALGVRRAPALLIACVVVGGAARGAAPIASLPDGVVADDRLPDRVIGLVEGPVIRTERGSGALVAGVWVWAEEVLAPGERIAVTGVVRTAPPGHGTGRRFELSARSIDHLDDAPDLAARTWRWAARTQAAAAREIDDAGGDPVGRAALRGIVIGDRTRVPAELDDRWRAIGIYHVLSVSGLHLAVVAGLVFAVLRRLIAASPWGGRVHPARWAAPPSLVFAIGYTLVTGAQLATVRALIVIALLLVAAMLDRPLRLIDALGAAALAILIWRPGDLLDPSFQLSFVAALTLALRPSGGARATTRRGRTAAWVVRGIATSAWIALTTAPLTAFHFQQVAAGGIVGNLVLTPPVELIALPLALAGIVLGPFGAPLIRAATWIVTIVDDAAGLLARITPVGHIAVATMSVTAVLVVISLWLAARPRRTRLDALAWSALCVAWLFARTLPEPGALRVTFLDVGQGDGAIIELPDGAVWVIDAGGNASARELASAATPGVVMSRTLAAYGHDRIDLAILSHPHPDHYLGFAAITVPITELWSATDADPAPPSGVRLAGLPAFGELAAALAARGTRFAHPPLGLAREEAGVTLEILAPRFVGDDGGPPIEATDPVRSVNDNSLVIVVRYRGRTILFAGDVEREGEDALLAAGVPAADVVKVPHHGSPTSSSASFVAATHPRLAVISCGRANAFGFPSAEVVARWTAAGSVVARTDLDGAVTVVVDAAGGLAVRR